MSSKESFFELFNRGVHFNGPKRSNVIKVKIKARITNFLFYELLNQSEKKIYKKLTKFTNYNS